MVFETQAKSLDKAEVKATGRLDISVSSAEKLDILPVTAAKSRLKEIDSAQGW